MIVLFLVTVDLGANGTSLSVILNKSLLLVVASGKQVNSSGNME